MRSLTALVLSLALSPRVGAVHRAPNVAVGRPKNDVLGRTFAVPRGGDLGPVSGEDIAKTIGTLAIADAVFGLKPVESWNMFGVTIEPGSAREHYGGHGISSSASSLAVSALAALGGESTAEEAIAYGFLARGAFMTEMLLSGKYKDVHANAPSVAPFVVVWLALLGTCFALLSGGVDGGSTAAKIVSVVLAAHGGLLYLNPSRAGGDADTQAMAKVDGGYMFASSLFAALLAFGMEPVRAMGFATIACFPVFLAFLDVMKGVDKIFGLSPSALSVILVLFLGASAFGMLS